MNNFGMNRLFASFETKGTIFALTEWQVLKISNPFQYGKRFRMLLSSSNPDELFLGRGSPALMSTKEPAFRLLTDRYNETFALTFGNEGRVHLFLIKVGLWSLVYTFVFKNAVKPEQISMALEHITTALNGRDKELAGKLDKAVFEARKRIEVRIARFKCAS